MASLGRAVAAVAGGGLAGRTAIRRGSDGRLHAAVLACAASGGFAADFGKGQEQLTLADAMRCCEALPGDTGAGWAVDWQAVADHVRDDPTLGLREKGADALRKRWERERQGTSGRAAIRVALSRLPPHAVAAGTMPRRGDNTTTLIHVPHTRSQHHYHNKKLTAQNPFLCVLYHANQACYSQLRMLLSDNQKTIRRWASTKCTPGYITHQMNAQRARLRPAFYSLATAGGANKIRSSTWVL